MDWLFGMKATRILLIDDHAMFRAGLSMVIKTAMSDTQIDEAASLDEAMAKVNDDTDVVLLDIKLNGSNGLDGIVMLRNGWPQLPILVLSAQDAPETIQLALERGAASFVSKAEAADKIIETIKLLLRDFIPAVLKKPTIENQQHLTVRQCEVLVLLHQGLSNKLIARKLSISDNTVRRHVQDILLYFNVTSRAEAVSAAQLQGRVG